MIPTFNNTRYLRQTLESVLAQDPGPDDMQIEVVDNCSTDHDIEEVVRGIAGRRVAVSRNGENLGAIGNFNRCIERSRGHLIHILHSDDFVSPNFYSELGRLASSHYDCAFYANRAFFVDEDGIIIGVSPRPTWMEEPTRDVKEMLRTQYFQCPGVVVRRAFYERFGGFAPELVYCADWEMWVRAVASAWASSIRSRWRATAHSPATNRRGWHALAKMSGTTSASTNIFANTRGIPQRRFEP